jgi:hypothetical protein
VDRRDPLAQANDDVAVAAAAVVILNDGGASAEALDAAIATLAAALARRGDAVLAACS